MYAIVDIETTGLGGEGNKITEIAIVIHDGHRVINEFHTLVNPGVGISPYVTGLTGISNDMVEDAPPFSEIADTVDNLTANLIFIAHSVNFDYNVIRSEFRKLGRDFTRRKLCTVRLSRQIFPGLKSYSLGNICRHLGITIKDRHRAKGDTDATVLLFEKLLANDQNKIFAKHLNQRSQELTLPPLLPTSVFKQLPESPGVYFFQDNNGKIIYVGKAINIKKRVLGHFYDKKEKEQALTRETAHIEYEETGNELLALVREASYIKQYFPKYNEAQKSVSRGYGILSYTDRNGVVRLGYNHLKNVPSPIKTFYTVTECIAFLEYLCEINELCPKYTQLQVNVQHCTHYKITNCRGVCRDEEPVESYNKRVLKAIEETDESHQDYVILGKGRTLQEQTLIFVENGNYAGFGFLDRQEQIEHFERFKDFIQPQRHHRDIQRILDAYMIKNSGKNIIYKNAEIL